MSEPTVSIGPEKDTGGKRDLTCGTQVWFTVISVNPEGAEIQMDTHPHVREPIVGYFFGLSPWQLSATIEPWPHEPGTPPPGWSVRGLGWLPDDQPWHLKIVEIATGGVPVGCAEVDFVVPQGIANRHVA